MNQVLEYLKPEAGKTYLDVTFGSGGHTRAILEREPHCRVIAMDWDTAALDQFGPALQEEFGDRIQLIWGNFALLYKILKKEKIESVDGILADFGTSQVQIVNRPGFSVYRDTALDMRMSPAHYQETAYQVLATFSEQALRELFWQLGEERHAKVIARAIVQERAKNQLTTTGQLADLIEKVVPSARGGSAIHPATRVFQALRIYVNKELDNINAFLGHAPTILKAGGRLVCISFHSLEDRLVKQFFANQEKAGILEVVTRKVVVAEPEEIKQNPSSRSAKLRAAVRL
jgi:16S rRNA (cytosine1402-N4)-methyltransferase